MFGRKPPRVRHVDDEMVAASISRLEALTARIETTAAALEALVARMREEDEEDVQL